MSAAMFSAMGRMSAFVRCRKNLGNLLAEVCPRRFAVLLTDHQREHGTLAEVSIKANWEANHRFRLKFATFGDLV
jgi:hypothetical protein